MTTDLRELLELASDDVREPDLGSEAWETASRQRRTVRRRAVLAGGAAVAAVSVLVVRERASAPTGADDALGVRRDLPLPTAVVGGVTVDLAPSPTDELTLPRYPFADELGLADTIGFDDALRMPKLGASSGRPQNADSVRAVLLAWTARATGMVPVLYAPARSAGEEYLVCAGAPLVRADPNRSGEGLVLDPRAIHVDRRSVVFPQPGEVVVLEARGGTALRIPVPDATLHRAGWARDGRTVIALGLERSWLVDTRDRSVRLADRPALPGRFDLHTEGAATSLSPVSASGERTATTPLGGAVLAVKGPTVGTSGGWAAAQASLGQTYVGAISRTQGVVAVHADRPADPRVLAATRGPGVPPGALRPVLWVREDVLVLESRSFPGASAVPVLRLLAWHVPRGRLYRVGVVGPVNPNEGGFTGAYAL